LFAEQVQRRKTNGTLVAERLVLLLLMRRWQSRYARGHTLHEKVGTEMDDQDKYSGPVGSTRYTLEETERVRQRLVDKLGSRVEFLYLALGLIPAGTRRLITEVSQQSIQDKCVFLHASRTVTNAMGALLNIERGLILEAYALTRHCLENVAQGIVFMRDPKEAEAWMAGKEFKPWKIREKLAGSPDVRPDYDRLSKLAHPNFGASRMHSTAVPPVGLAVWYGGSYKPKAAAQVLVVLTRTVSLFLREYFRQYSDRLDLVDRPAHEEPYQAAS
jgi:hypothetical protein